MNHVAHFPLNHSKASSLITRGRPPTRRPCAPEPCSPLPNEPPTLILYTKPACSLCDGLKDKLTGLISRSQFVPSVLSSLSFTVRDINDNAAWSIYENEVPVLFLQQVDGSLSLIPGAPPRITADRLQMHLEKAINELQQLQS